MDSRTEEIRARASKATPGPWKDVCREYLSVAKADRKRSGRWYHGTLASSCPIALVVQDMHHGEPLNLERDFPHKLDKHDLTPVIQFWWDILPKKRTSIVNTGILRGEDADFIAHSRSDIDYLLARVALLESLLKPV